MEKIKVLVVEDNKMNLKLVKSLLQLSNIQVFEAEDAEHGINLARLYSPNLILMDIQLPGMDGLTATRLIKQDPCLANIPVIALTSHAMQGDDDKAKKSGCDGYITKPIDTRNFRNQISQYLELAEKKPASYQNSPSPASPVSHYHYKPRILIVDDEPINIKLINAVLALEKYELLNAANGQTALDIVANHSRIDLILLDIMMPGMDGYEVTTRLKGEAKTKDIPIILVTALDSRENKLHGLELGADEYITKPINKVEILARIKSMLYLRQYQEQFNIRQLSEKYFISSQNNIKLSQQNTSQASSTLLLVEDNEKDIKLFESITNSFFNEMIIARNGEEAIELLQNKPNTIDIIILDLLLPGMSGYTVCKMVKNNFHTRNIQVLMVTCLTDLETKIKGIEEGVDDYLVKPVDSREIKSRVNALLKKKKYLDHLTRYYENSFGLAARDEITGFYNQAYLTSFLKAEIEYSKIYDYSFGLLILEINNNHDKILNYAVGEIILKEVSMLIKNNIRDVDLPARYNEWKFAIIMPYIDSVLISSIAENIRTTICNHTFPNHIASSYSNVTARFSLSLFPSSANTSEDLICNAEHLLTQTTSHFNNFSNGDF